MENEHTRMSNVTKQMEKSNELLKDARKNLINTNDIALEISGELDSQHNKLDNIKNNINKINTDTNIARRLIRNIEKYNKRYYLYLLLIIVVLIILIVIIYKYA
jgi:hypothetical protein